MTKTQPPADDLVERIDFDVVEDMAINIRNGFRSCDRADHAAMMQRLAAELIRWRDIAGELAGAVKPFAAAAVIIEADRKIWIEQPVNETGELEIEHFARARTAYAKYQHEQGL